MFKSIWIPQAFVKVTYSLAKMGVISMTTGAELVRKYTPILIKKFVK